MDQSTEEYLGFPNYFILFVSPILLYKNKSP